MKVLSFCHWSLKQHICTGQMQGKRRGWENISLARTATKGKWTQWYWPDYSPHYIATLNMPASICVFTQHTSFHTLLFSKCAQVAIITTALFLWKTQNVSCLMKRNPINNKTFDILRFKKTRCWIMIVLCNWSILAQNTVSLPSRSLINFIISFTAFSFDTFSESFYGLRRLSLCCWQERCD